MFTIARKINYIHHGLYLIKAINYQQTGSETQVIQSGC